MNWKMGAGAALAVVIVGGAVWYLQRPDAVQTPVAAPVPVAAPTPASSSGEVERRPPPPSLPAPAVSAPVSANNSDGAVHAAVADFAPQLLQWLTPKEQVRRWIAMVDQLADGSLPIEQRPLTYPMQPFKVVRREHTMSMDRSNFARMAPLVDAFTAIPPERMAQYYQTWRPLLEKTYRELGRGGSFDQRLRVAIQRVEAAKPLPDLPELVRPSVYYKYADPAQEKANDVQKLLWRMGPDNAQRVQEYLKKLEPLL